VLAPADWALRRRHIRAAMEQVMGPLPPADRSPPAFTVQEELTTDTYLRQHIRYVVEADDLVPAWLFTPRPGGRRAPAMLGLHQTTPQGKDEAAGLSGRTNLFYARELAERGYVVLVPDYPNFGEYRLDPYAGGYVSATMKGIVNHRRAVDLLRSLPEVEPQRIGVIGHSLGGHNALFLAAFDDRVRVVVTSCGFNSFFKYYGGDLTGWSHAGYMPRIASVYGKDPGRVPFDFPEVLAALAPRPVFINAPLHDDNFEVSGVQDCVRAAGAVYALLGARDRLEALHPDCGHDFPPAVRQQAYDWLSRWL
jgi:dienelactone hydrolase